MYRLRPGLIVAVIVASTTLAHADILEVRGSVNASVAEIAGGAVIERNEVDEFLPDTQPDLPIRSVARVFSAQTATPRAGIAAAQISDITDSVEPNPQDFSVNLALNSLDKDVFFRGRARAEEIRVVQFSRSQLDLPADVDSRSVESHLFLDGVLALFSAAGDRDFTGASVVLHVQVEKRGGNDESSTLVFDGTIALTGASGGAATTSITGGIPADRVLNTSLTTSENGLPAFPAIIIPQIELSYEYTARVDEPFELVATITVEAECRSPDAGAVALIGTPVDDLRAVIDEITIPPLTAGVVSVVDDARSARRDEAAVDSQPLFSLPGACGAIGFESLVGVMFAGMALRRGRFLGS